jgi:hypothetical protein
VLYISCIAATIVFLVGARQLISAVLCGKRLHFSSRLHFEPLNFPHTPTEMIATYSSLDSASLRPWGHHLDPLRSAYLSTKNGLNWSKCEVARNSAKQARILRNTARETRETGANLREFARIWCETLAKHPRIRVVDWSRVGLWHHSWALNSKFKIANWLKKSST